MDEKDFDDLLRAMMGETKAEDDETEKGAKQVAHFMYTYYKHFLLAGFDDNKAFSAAMYMLEKVVFGTIRK